MRVIFAGGGTGGHLFPGLAVAREFQRRDPMTEILFMGTAQGIEYRVLPKQGYRLETLPVRGLKGRGLRGVIDALYGVPASLLALVEDHSRVSSRLHHWSGRIRFRPGAARGKAGGHSLRDHGTESTSRIHQQAARTLRRSRLYRVSRERGSFPRRSRGRDREPGALAKTARRFKSGDKFSLLIFGGSLGARRINFAVIDALKQLLDLKSEIFITHQTGELDFAAIRAAYDGLPFDAEVTPFIDKMDEAYAQADLVLCRAGATTVAELTAFGKAAILVPYPYAIYDHQRGNAQALHERGAAEMILDQELNGEILARRIRGYLSDRASARPNGGGRSRCSGGPTPPSASSMSVTVWPMPSILTVTEISCCKKSIKFISSVSAASA